MPKYVYELIKCPFCNEVRKSVGLHRHIKTHGSDKWAKYLSSKKSKLNIIEINGSYKCPECKFIGKTMQSATSHWWRNHTVKGKLHSSNGGSKPGPRGPRKSNKPAWNKGLTKDTDLRVKKNSLSVSKTIQQQLLDGTFKPKKMSDEARLVLSERQSLVNSGGRCKWFTIAGNRVQGTYEKQFAEQLEFENIRWEKIKTNNHIFKYVYNDKVRSYAPDFYLPDFNIYVEIKGFWWGDDENKMRCIKDQHIDKHLIILYGKEKLDYICKNIKEKLPLEPVWSW